MCLIVKLKYMKIKIVLILVLDIFVGSLQAKDDLIPTPDFSLLTTAAPGEKVMFRYYGSRISE